MFNVFLYNSWPDSIFQTKEASVSIASMNEPGKNVGETITYQHFFQPFMYNQMRTEQLHFAGKTYTYLYLNVHNYKPTLYLFKTQKNTVGAGIQNIPIPNSFQI